MIVVLWSLFGLSIFFVHRGLLNLLRYFIVKDVEGGDKLAQELASIPAPLLLHLMLFIVAFFISTGVVLTVYFILEIL